MTEVRFHRRADDHYAVVFPYDPDVVRLVKCVPSRWRGWNPETKEWRVSDLIVDDLIAALRRDGHTVTSTAPKAPSGGGGDTGNWAEILFRRMGQERVEPVFRLLTRVVHPDNPLTGDTGLQRELNDAREKFR